MVCVQLKEKKYEYFKQRLVEMAKQEPFDVCFIASVEINSNEYILKIQPDGARTLYVLQALKIAKKQQGKAFELITDKYFLVSLMNILVCLWVG